MKNNDKVDPHVHPEIHLKRAKVTPIYTIIPDDDYLVLKEFQTSGNTSKGTYLSKKVLLNRWEKSNKTPLNQYVFDFYLSCMVVVSGEPQQRFVIKRKTTRNARNIEFKIKEVQQYLREAMGQTKQTKNNAKKINSTLKKAFVDVKTQLGFPAINPVEYSYEITDEVIATASTDACTEYLNQNQSRSILFDSHVQKIETTLNADFQSEAKEIISALKRTKTREHLSAVSINTENDETFVHIVNPTGDQIKMESWKFLLLIEYPQTPRQLQDFDNRSYGDPVPPFIFNHCKKGIVEGRYDRKTSSIQVYSHEKETTDKAIFFIDSTYTLCLYTTLKKLKEDKIRFTTLREQADSTIGNRDEYDKIFNILNMERL